MPEPAIYLTQDDAARILFVARRTLTRWRTEGKGPKFVRMGQRVAP